MWDRYMYVLDILQKYLAKKYNTYRSTKYVVNNIKKGISILILFKQYCMEGLEISCAHMNFLEKF